MNSVVQFNFEAHQIRTVMIDGIPWFCARDVALALRYQNPSEAYHDHCKLLKLLSYSELLELQWAYPNPRGEYVIPEPDVYRLILKSKKPEAVRFEKWVMEEVLPTLRKTGTYTLQAPQPEVNALFSQALRLMADHFDSINQHLATTDQRLYLTELELSKWRALVTRKPALRLVHPGQGTLFNGTPQGKTRASPKPHERHGHYRTLPNGTRLWVRDHFVGKKDK